MKLDPKNNEHWITYDEYMERELKVPGFVQEDDETYIGCDTITAPDGKEYPIKDRD